MVVPSNEEIGSLLESQFRSHFRDVDLAKKEETLFQFGNLNQLFTDDVKVTIVGQDFSLAGQSQGRDEFEQRLASGSVPRLSSIIDVTKPIQGKPVQVIGGTDDEWKAVVLSSTATTKTQKAWNHEMVVLLHFNSQGKITELKAYPDTQYISNRISEST